MKTILIIIGLLAAGCGAGSNGAATADPCADFELDVKKVWNAEARIRLSAAMKEISAGGSAVKEEEVVTKMDDVTRDWVMLKQSACNDHFKRGLLSAEEYRKKADCFDAFLQHVRAMLTALEKGDGVAADGLMTAPGELDQCH